MIPRTQEKWKERANFPKLISDLHTRHGMSVHTHATSIHITTTIIAIIC